MSGIRHWLRENQFQQNPRYMADVCKLGNSKTYLTTYNKGNPKRNAFQEFEFRRISSDCIVI